MCSIFLCPNSATHSYQCVQHFPVSKQRYPFLSVCAAFSCVQTALPIPISVCSIFLCPNSATHSCQCVQHFPVSKQRYPFLSVCAAFSCVQTALPIPISVCSIFLCPNSATHSYQCVQYFPVSKQRYPFLSVCAVFSCVQTAVQLPAFGIVNVRTDVMHAIAHGGCTDTVRESAPEADSGRKILCRTGTRTRVSIAPGFSVWHSTN